MPADGGEATTLVAPMPQREGMAGPPPVPVEAVVAQQKEEDQQPTMAAPPPQQQPEEKGEQPTMAADAVVAPSPPPPEEEEPTMAADAVDEPMPPPPQQQPKEEGEQPTIAAGPGVAPAPPPPEEEMVEDEQPTMAAEDAVVPMPPPPSQPEEKEKEDEQPVPPAAMPQPLESGPHPAEETSQTNNPLQFMGPADKRDKEIWKQSLQDDCDDSWDHLLYREHLFRRSRYDPMDCYLSYHDDPLHYENGYLDRNGYTGYRHVGYPFGPYGHGYRNQYKYRPMNPLHDKSVYVNTTCCSRNLICGKKDWPVGASLSNPEKWICFLNCILQCVVHTVPLVLKLLKHRHLGQCPSGSEEFCCYCSLRHHASEVIRLSGYVLYPKKFVKCLKLVFQDFERGQHQDAHEFLRCLLDKLDGASVVCRSSSEEPSSIVKEIFGGQLKSQLHCPECNHCSDRLESFLDLNLEVNQMETVMDSLRSFTKIEVVEDFICDECKSRVNMEKRLKVEQAPEVLVIQLKRFQNLGSDISKIHDMVKYELELDLNPFMSYPDDKPQNYDLYGVVEHLGNSYKGHYVCYIRSSETDWFLFDDDKVMKMTEDRILNNKAYLLFYVKQGSSPWFSSLLERRDTLSGYLQELLDEGLDENGLLIDSEEGSYSGSDEQDTAAHYFGGAEEKNEAGPSLAGLSHGIQGNANGSTMFSVPDENEVSCNLGGGLSGEKQKHTSFLRSSTKNGNCGRLELVLWNKENLSPQGSHGTREMSHNIHGQVHDEGSHGGSPQENGKSCNLLQSSSAYKHEDGCCPENLTLHKDGMKGSCNSSAGSPCARKRIVTSRRWGQHPRKEADKDPVRRCNEGEEAEDQRRSSMEDEECSREEAEDRYELNDSSMEAEECDRGVGSSRETQAKAKIE